MYKLDEIAGQEFKSSLGGTQQLTSWKGFHVLHVSESNRGQEAHGNSHTGRDFIRCTSAIQTKVRRRTATHELEGISCVARQRFKRRSGGARQLTSWKGFHGLHVSDLYRVQEAHGDSPSKLGELFLCRQFEITNVTCLLPICYIQNFPSFHIESITSSPLSFT